VDLVVDRARVVVAVSGEVGEAAQTVEATTNADPPSPDAMIGRVTKASRRFPVGEPDGGREHMKIV
jgi:hypothetical protein